VGVERTKKTHREWLPQHKTEGENSNAPMSHEKKVRFTSNALVRLSGRGNAEPSHNLQVNNSKKAPRNCNSSASYQGVTGHEVGEEG